MIVTVFWLIPFQIHFRLIDFKGLIVKYILAESPEQLWFLFMLFDLFIMAFFMSKIKYKNKVVEGVSGLLVYAVGFVGMSVLPNYFQIFIACQYYLFFLIGSMIKK